MVSLTEVSYRAGNYIKCWWGESFKMTKQRCSSGRRKRVDFCSHEPPAGNLERLKVSNILFSAHQAILPGCIWCTFFHLSILRPSGFLLEGHVFRLLNGKFFVLEASSVCSNVASPLNRTEHNVFFFLTRHYESWFARHDRRDSTKRSLSRLKRWWGFRNIIIIIIIMSCC